MKAKKYVVTLTDEYASYIVYDMLDLYNKTFETLNEAREFMKQAAKEIKMKVKGCDRYKADLEENTITVDIEKYCVDPKTLEEEYCGLADSRYICGKY